LAQQILAELGGLASEARNPRTGLLDRMTAMELVRTMNDEDHGVAAAVAKVLPSIAEAVDCIVDSFSTGGRLIYVGAGTSGRLGVLDASECPPTFGVEESMVVGLIAGGDYAIRHAVEGAEDDEAAAIVDLQHVGLKARDTVVGLAASGRTPYVVSALRYARNVGAKSVAVTCNPGSAIAAESDIAIVPEVGPEVLTGSTRLKSGTAQKLVLNMLSTASMVRSGKAFGNLMVDLRATNEKLKARAVRIVADATGCSDQQARGALDDAGQNAKLAIFILLSGLDRQEAEARLASANGMLRVALDAQHANGKTSGKGD
jgi:N-acetylmuramic acid 6-phosphate etherase